MHIGIGSSLHRRHMKNVVAAANRRRAAAMCGDHSNPEVRRVADEAAAAAVDAARLYSWQVAWDEHVRRSVHVEAAHLEPGDTPLRQVFRLLDADGGGTLSLRGIREGEAEVLSLPISPRVLDPYFRSARDEGGIDDGRFRGAMHARVRDMAGGSVKDNGRCYLLST